MMMAMLMAALLSLGQSAPVDQPDADKITPLMRAAATGDVKAVNALLAKGANPDLQHDELGVNALMCAAYFGRVDVTQALLAKGAKPNVKDSTGASAADWATLGGFDPLAKALVDQGALLNPFLNVGVMPMWLMDVAAGKK
jgi:uncharacterized protein